MRVRRPGGASPSTSVTRSSLRSAGAPGGAGWSQRDRLGAVSCATGLCAATEASPAGGYPSVVTLTPRGRSTTSVAVATYQQLSQISCPSANLCVVSDTAGEVHVSTNPTVPHPAWSGVQIGTAPQCDKYNCNYDPILTVSCASEHLCVASDANDSPITLPSPRGRVPMQISSLSCPTTHACVAVDGAGGGYVVVGDPSGGTWSASRLDFQPRASRRSTRLADQRLVRAHRPVRRRGRSGKRVSRNRHRTELKHAKARSR